MSRRELAPVTNDATRDHDAVASRLPWYVNGTLGALETERVEAHLAVCARCRADADVERLVARTMRESAPVGLAPQAGLAAVMERIERREARRRWWKWPPSPLRGEITVRPLLFAVGVQGVVIVMLTSVLWLRLAREPAAEAASAYRTLSTPSSPAPVTTGVRVRLVLADDMSLGALREALEPWHSRIVAGPEGRGIYTVTIEGDVAAALAALRSTPGVSFAERVDGP